MRRPPPDLTVSERPMAAEIVAMATVADIECGVLVCLAVAITIARIGIGRHPIGNSAGASPAPAAMLSKLIGWGSDFMIRDGLVPRLK